MLRPPVSVGDLCHLLRASLESDPLFRDIWISGEISNYLRSAAGHMYFTLKDGSGQLRCAFFKRANLRSAVRLADGDSVLVHGMVSIYPQRGELQVIVDDVEPEGVGILQAEYERLRRQLEEEGLFSEQRKRPIPNFPRRVGLVTSPDGAVFHDVCHVLRRRWPLVEVVLAPTLVQGDGACEGVCNAIQDLNDAPGIDVIIVCRGGGSLEDLLTFNLEAVARAIFASRVPVISAIGHETDYTIADFVADLRAPTPSAAAEIVAPDQVEIAARTGGFAEALGQALRRNVQEARWELSGTLTALRYAAPDTATEHRRVADQRASAECLLRRLLDKRYGDVGERYVQLNALSPTNTLARGYALVRRATDARAVISQRDLVAGDGIQVTLADGEFRAEVIGYAERNGHGG